MCPWIGDVEHRPDIRARAVDLSFDIRRRVRVGTGHGGAGKVHALFHALVVLRRPKWKVQPFTHLHPNSKRIALALQIPPSWRLIHTFVENRYDILCYKQSLDGCLLDHTN